MNKLRISGIVSIPSKVGLLLAGILLIQSCLYLSNRDYAQANSSYRGIRRVVVFVQRWPIYLQLPHQNELGAEFIRKNTMFLGPWEPAGRLSPRGVDIADINDAQIGEALLRILEHKGYQAFLAEVPFAPGQVTVERIMAQYQALDSQVQAFIFCFYSPVLFFASADSIPGGRQDRSYSLVEVEGLLQPGAGSAIWAGPRAAKAPKDSFTHAFVYISMTMFKALDWQIVWTVADSQSGGRLRRWLPQCLPAPTEENYWADAAMIQRLMRRNLNCRLRHLIPDAL